MLLRGLVEGRGFCKLMAWIYLVDTRCHCREQLQKLKYGEADAGMQKICYQANRKLTNLHCHIVVAHFRHYCWIRFLFYDFVWVLEKWKSSLLISVLEVNTGHKTNIVKSSRSVSFPVFPWWHRSVLSSKFLFYMRAKSHCWGNSPVSDRLTVLTMFLWGDGWAEAIKDLPQNFSSRYVESDKALDSHCWKMPLDVRSIYMGRLSSCQSE